MKKLVKYLVLICTILSITFPVKASDDYTKTTIDSKLVNELFESKLRLAGREIAKEKGLILPSEMYALHNSMYERTACEKETEIFYDEIKNNSITINDIYSKYPELAREALETENLDSSYIAPLTVEQNRGEPAFGSYRQQTYYTYYERAETDSINSETYSSLAGLLISIASIGLKPAQAIFYSVLQSIAGAYTIQTSRDCHLTTLYEHCLTGKWGEVYSSGGALCENRWLGFVYTCRTDTYAIASAIAWKGNQCYANTTSPVLVNYEYNQYYYDSVYLWRRSLEMYQEAYDLTYTYLYGVLPGHVEYNITKHFSWTNSQTNPFA